METDIKYVWFWVVMWFRWDFHRVDDMVAIFIYTEGYSGGKAVNRLVKRAMERLVVTDVPFYFLYAYHRVSGITNLDTLKWIFNPSFYYTFIWIIESYFLPLIYSFCCCCCCCVHRFACSFSLFSSHRFFVLFLSLLIFIYG